MNEEILMRVFFIAAVLAIGYLFYKIIKEFVFSPINERITKQQLVEQTLREIEARKKYGWRNH